MAEPKTELKFILIPYLIKFLMTLITMTCRVRWHNKVVLDELTEQQQAWILSMWHNLSLIHI